MVARGKRKVSRMSGYVLQQALQSFTHSLTGLGIGLVITAPPETYLGFYGGKSQVLAQ